MNMKTLIFGTVLLAASLGVKAQTVGTLVTSGLAEPFGVTVDSNNKYYVTDSANNRVAMYDPGTGVLTNFATGMFNPQGIVAVPGGIVVSDSGNNRLVMLSADGTLNHLAGSATGEPGYADGIGAAAVFNSPAGLAYSASEDAVYVADMLNHIVRKVDLTTTNVTTVVTNDLYRPSDVAVDEQGRVFIADTGNHSIVMSTNGTPVLIAGSGTSYQSGYEDATPGTSALLNSPRGLI
ncbi:MAG: NHL repeat-containing protein, partial [Verrucomicrobia bacterium]|nr:NHL repeat-containing protein [Verrucomicrobiota bacterium]